MLLNSAFKVCLNIKTYNTDTFKFKEDDAEAKCIH